MSDPYREARKGNQDNYFRSQVLVLLERIAIALENPPRYLEPLQDFVPPEERQADDEAFVKQPVHLDNPAGDVCRCGNDVWLTCDACSPARLAFVHNQRDRDEGN